MRHYYLPFTDKQSEAQEVSGTSCYTAGKQNTMVGCESAVGSNSGILTSVESKNKA